MPTVNYIDPNGETHVEEVPFGYTLMEGAFNQQIAGMLAECGGAAACGTCHAYIDENWLGTIPPVEDLEDAMLVGVNDRRENSRLSCQVHMTEEMDGIVVRIADN